MKKKIFALVFALLLMIPVFSLNAKEKEKVKVYVFEAGGCPYCEEEIKYLESLDSYNKKFVIEKRELYVDHVNWAKGRDYELGKAVAEKFKEDGFENAAYDGTPFVVISDVYAAATYSTDLESYINKAYKEGDEDVVNKIAKKLKVENVNRDDIGEGEGNGNSGTTTETYKFVGEKPNALVVVAALVLLVGAMVFIIKTGNKNDEENDEVEEEKEEVVEEEEEVKKVKKEKPVTKKAQSKTSTAKKSTAKKTTNTKRKTNKK